MTGPLGLVGSGEFSPAMLDTDRALLDQAEDEGFERAVAVVPTASSTEGDAVVRRWLDLARAHYDALDAEVLEVDVRTRGDAVDLAHVADVGEAGMVYLSGGKPDHLVDVLRATPLLDAILERWRLGAPLLGCSAGAMAIAAGWPPFLRPSGPWGTGLGLLDEVAVLPHFDRVRRLSLGRLTPLGRQAPAGWAVVGVDEDTALVHPGSEGDGGWRIEGRGQAWSIDADGVHPLDLASLRTP